MANRCKIQKKVWLSATTASCHNCSERGLGRRKWEVYFSGFQIFNLAIGYCLPIYLGFAGQRT